MIIKVSFYLEVKYYFLSVELNSNYFIKNVIIEVNKTSVSEVIISCRHRIARA